MGTDFFDGIVKTFSKTTKELGKTTKELGARAEQTIETQKIRGKISWQITLSSPSMPSPSAFSEDQRV